MANFKLFSSLVIFLTIPMGLFAEEPPKQKEAAPVAANEENRAPAMASAPKKIEEKPLALSAEAIRELEEREKSIEEREKELEERSQAIAVQEKVLYNKLKRIEEVSAKMAGRLDKYKEDTEGRVAKIVAMLETMKPDASAAYIESVDPFLAVEVMARINVQKAAKIWNKMDKKVSARLSELYTGFRSKIEKETTTPSPANNDSAKSIPAPEKG